MWGGSTISKILHPFQDESSTDSLDIKTSQFLPESISNMKKQRTNSVIPDEQSSQWNGTNRYEPSTTESSGLHGFLGNVFNWFKNGQMVKHEEPGFINNDIDKQYDSSNNYDDDIVDDGKYHGMLQDSFSDEEFLNNPPDKDISETLNLIRDRERHWKEEQDTRELLGLKYSNPESTHASRFQDCDRSEVDVLIRRLENNNEILLRMIENFDNATFKTDYKQVKEENAKITQKYFKLRREFKVELQESKNFHRKYYDLAKKYQLAQKDHTKERLENTIEQLKLRVETLEKKDARNQKEIDKLSAGRRQLVKSMLQRVKDNESSQQAYEDKLGEIKSHYLKKVKSAENLRSKLQKAEEELKELKSKNMDAFQHERKGLLLGYESPYSESSSDLDNSGYYDYHQQKEEEAVRKEVNETVERRSQRNNQGHQERLGTIIEKENLNEEGMNTIDLLRQKYADKKYNADLTGTVNTSISKPTINIGQ